MCSKRKIVTYLFVVFATLQFISCDYEAPQKTFEDYLGRCIMAYHRNRGGAIENCRNALALNPKSAVAYLYWGMTLGIDMPDEAVEKYRKALELDPHFGRVYFEWGNLLKYQGKLGEAIEKYRKLSELNPKSYVAYKFWADTLKQQGKLEEAEEMFRRASEVDPTIHRGK